MSNWDQIARPWAATMIADVSRALRNSFGATRNTKIRAAVFQSEKNHGFVLLDRSMGGASLGGAPVACTFD